MRFIRNKNGFSLVEMVVYIAILTLMSVYVVNSLTTLTRSYNDLRLAKNVNNSAAVALQRMVYEIRQASTVDSVNSTFGTSPGQLTLNTTDASGNATTAQFFVLNGVLRVKMGGVDQGPITQSNAVVTNLIFKQVQNSISKGIVITLGLQSSFGTKVRSETFYTTAVLRNIY